MIDKKLANFIGTKLRACKECLSEFNQLLSRILHIGGGWCLERENFEQLGTLSKALSKALELRIKSAEALKDSLEGRKLVDALDSLCRFAEYKLN